MLVCRLHFLFAALSVLTALSVPSLSSSSALINVRSEGVVIIPGIGRVDRLQTTVGNLHMLANYLQGNQDHSPSWDCVAYIYAQHNDSVFWSAYDDLAVLTKYCDIIRNPGKRVTENLYMAQPALLKKSYEYVFVLLDDCKLLGQDKFPLDYIVRVMKLNRLGVASPMVSR